MKLICIDDETDILKFGNGKEYEIISFYEKTHDSRQFIKLINDKGRSNDYLIDRFVSLERFREIQLNKIGI